MKIYLASRSPRRKLLLEQVGIPFSVIDVDIDENWDGKETARNYVERLAKEKAVMGIGQITENENTVVLGADTAVVLDGEVFGKAGACEDAAKMLSRLSGRQHYVYSAIALAGEQMIRSVVVRTAVCFKVLTEREIADYSQSDEPLGKAGGYAIQGMAAKFIESIHGSYTGVVGLPLYEASKLLQPYQD